MIRSQGGEEALRQWQLLEDKMRPLQQGAALFPAAALRSDPGKGCLVNEKKQRKILPFDCPEKRPRQGLLSKREKTYSKPGF